MGEQRRTGKRAVTAGVRSVVLGTWVLLSLVAAWRIVAHTRADDLAHSNPQAALAWIANHPDALEALAEQQLSQGDVDSARGTAERLLAAAPLEGRGARLMGQLAEKSGHIEDARKWFERAAHKSPRDLVARRWLAKDDLKRADYAGALSHLDALLRYYPAQALALVPAIVGLTPEPAFATALQERLKLDPPWRRHVMAELLSGRHPAGANRVLTAMRAAGQLSDDDHKRWVEALMRQGAWGEAYARWSSRIPPATSLPLAYNGGFETPPTGWGFDWQVRAEPGVDVSFDDEAGNTVARIEFRRRPVAEAGLALPMLLGAGRHQLSLRSRAEALVSDRGLEWRVDCLNGRTLGAAERLSGSFGWRPLKIVVEVPADCPGQWLRLGNPAPAGRGQYTSGVTWLDDVFVTRINPN